MPIVKTYRYSIQIDKVHQFLDIQKRADFLYKENLRYSQALYKMRGGSGQWLEIQTFPDFDTMQKADTLVDHVPELKELFQQFLKILDPKDPSIHEEIFEDYSDLP